MILPRLGKISTAVTKCQEKSIERIANFTPWLLLFWAMVRQCITWECVAEDASFHLGNIKSEEELEFP